MKSRRPFLSLYLAIVFQVLCLAGAARQGGEKAKMQEGGGKAVQLFGFGGSLSVTSGPFFATYPSSYFPHDERDLFFPSHDKRDLFFPYSAHFQFLHPLTYDSFQRRLAQDPHGADFWIKFSIRNNTDSLLSVDIYYGIIDYTDCWFAGSNYNRIHITGGSLRPARSAGTLIQRQYYTLPFTLRPRESGEVLICLRQKTRYYSFEGLGLYSPDALGTAFSQDYEREHAFFFFQWLFQGFLLCQVLFTLFQWLIIRRREYLYYLFYMAAISLYFLSKFEVDLGLNLLFAHYPVLGVYLGKTLMIVAYFLYFRFVRAFLEIPANYPQLNKWFVRIEYFLLLYAAADLVFILFTMDDAVQTHIFTVVLLLVFLVAASFIVYLFRRRQALIYYVLTGSLFVAVGNISGQVFTWLQDNKHFVAGFNILIVPQAGVLLEMLCFTAGLAYKSHMWEKEKIRNQEKLIEQLKANELLQTRVQTIRNKIAQDLHDDIGSTLSSISILSDLAMRGDNNDQAFETMHEIKDSSILLMERMDDIVWSINPRNDSLEHLLMRVRHFATTLFEARGLDYTIDIQKNIYEVKLPMDYRQHIYLILKEAINNLVKYAQASQAVIEVRWDRHRLDLFVRDNGRGFDVRGFDVRDFDMRGFDVAGSSTLSGPSMGNGILGMRRRAELMNALLEIRSGPGEGTEIRLHVGCG